MDAGRTEGRLGLGPDDDDVRALLDGAVRRVLDHLASVDRAPIVRREDAGARSPSPPSTSMDPASDAAALAIGDAGHDAAAILDDVFGRVLPPGLDTAAPGYLGWIPGGGLLAAAIGDFIGAAMNRYVGIRQPAPGLAALEREVIRWMARAVGLARDPDATGASGSEAIGGFLASGGSIANLAAIAAARVDRLDDASAGVLYASDQAHHSVAKAARTAGLASDALRCLPTDASGLALDPAAVARAIRADRSAGRAPFLLVANAGTTNTGAIDPLDALTDVARDEGLWLHVDAAYGGFFGLTERGRAALAGIDRADSVTVDPHKSLFLPYGSGALLVRDERTLGRAFDASADYLPEREDEPGVDAASISPELSRETRGLRVWLPLVLHGTEAFRAALDEKLDLAREACDRLAEDERLEIVTRPALTLFTFRMREPGHWKSRKLLRDVNASGRVFLSPTRIHGRFVLRMCVLSFRTRRETIDEAVAIIRRSAAEIDS